MSARLIALLGIAVLIEILVALGLRDPQAPAMQAYRLIHLAEMAALIALVWVEVGASNRIAQLVLAGLALSFVGDVVNSYLFDLTQLLKPQTLLSIPPFVAAHICYVVAFVLLIRDASRRPLPWMPLALVWPLLALGLWWLVINGSAPPLLHKLSLGYAFVVTLMGMMALQLGLRLGGRAWIPAAGGLVFMLSDGILGLYLLEGPDRPMLASQAIWTTYFLAQGLISQLVILTENKVG